MPKFSKPNWEKYAHIPEWEIFEAAALSLDIEPVEVRRWLNDQIVRRTLHDVSSEFSDRFEILVRNAAVGDGFGQPMRFPINEETIVPAGIVSRWLVAKDLRPLARQIREVAEMASLPVATWPWGEYETPQLAALREFVRRFWVRFDCNDRTTAPTKPEATKYLVKELGVGSNVADAIWLVCNHPESRKGGPKRRISTHSKMPRKSV